MKKSSRPSASRSPTRTCSLGRIANQSCHFVDEFGRASWSTNFVPSDMATYTSPYAVGLSVAKVTMSALRSPLTSPRRGRSCVDTAKKPCQTVGGRNFVPSDRAT